MTNPDPNLLAAFERAQRMRERRRLEKSDDPLLWMVIGITLVCLFIAALSVPWFPHLSGR